MEFELTDKQMEMIRNARRLEARDFLEDLLKRTEESNYRIDLELKKLDDKIKYTFTEYKE